MSAAPMDARRQATPPPAAGEELMNLVMRAGKLLLENGAEVFRVQQTMDIIARSYGGQDVNIYVLTNGLYCSMEGQRTRVAYVPEATTHLGRVTEINALSRRIAAGQVPLAEAIARLDAIAALPPTPAWGQVAACAAGSACFAMLFGGLWGFVGMIVGVPLFAVIYDLIRKFAFWGLHRNGQTCKLTDYHDAFGNPSLIKTHAATGKLDDCPAKNTLHSPVCYGSVAGLGLHEPDAPYTISHRSSHYIVGGAEALWENDNAAPRKINKNIRQTRMCCSHNPICNNGLPAQYGGIGSFQRRMEQTKSGISVGRGENSICGFHRRLVSYMRLQ